MILKIPIKRGYVYFFSSMEPNFLKKIYKRTKIQKLYHENKNRVLIFLLYFFLKKNNSSGISWDGRQFQTKNNFILVWLG